MACCWIGKPDDGGRALALLHGAGGSHTLWGEVFRRLRETDVPVLALDFPGHGRCAGPARETIGAYAETAEEALSDAGAEHYVVAGHSLGGAVALTLAVRGAAGLRGAGAVSTGARLPVDPRILEGTLKAFDCTVENLARFLFAKGTAADVLRQAAEMMAAAGPETLHADFSACSAYGLGPEELAGIRVPVEVVCGEKDVLTPMPLSEELFAAIPGSRLTRLPAAGHMPLLEDPEGVTEALKRLWARSFE